MKITDNWGVPVPVWPGPCNCCGMTYRNPEEPLKEIRSAGKGIRVIYGTHGRERDTGAIRIKHLETKNGVLTIVNKVV